MTRLALAGALTALMIAAPVGAQTDPTRDSEARGLFEAGVSAYEGGRYEEALRYFQQSYELSGRPALLYNIGTAAERAREDELALRSYEEYLERVPDAEQRARVETRIAALRSIVERDAEAEDEVVASPTSSADPAPWIVVGSGAAVAIAGGVLLGLGLADQAAVENPAEGARWADAEAAYERGPAILTSGVVLLPAGVVIAAIGVVWAILPSSPGAESVTVRVGPGSLSVSGRF